MPSYPEGDFSNNFFFKRFFLQNDIYNICRNSNSKSDKSIIMKFLQNYEEYKPTFGKISYKGWHFLVKKMVKIEIFVLRFFQSH